LRASKIGIALLLALATGCGSTVEGSGTASSPDELQAGATGTASSAAPGAGPSEPGAVGSSASLGGGTVAAGATSTGSASTVPGAGRTSAGHATAASIATSGRGWDAKTVYVGVMTQQDVQSVAQSAGVNSVDSGDQVGDVNAVLKHINATGGLFGRKVVADIVDIKTTGDSESQGEAACQHFTHDRLVVAVYAMALVGDTPSFRACMAQAAVPVLAGGGQAFDDKVFSDLGGYYTLMPFPSYNPFLPYFVNRLVAQNYFSPWDTNKGAPGTAKAKVGYLCPDTPIGHRVGGMIERELTRVGHPTNDAIYYSTNPADVSGYVLQFKADGVTHVLFCDLNLFVFATQAESQHYRPRYGVSTFNTPVLFLQGVVPNAQLNGAIGSGFDPTLDVDSQRDPSLGIMPAVAQCERIAKQSGISYPPAKRFAHAVLRDTCDILQLIVASARTAGALDGPGIVRGLGIAGKTFPSAITWRSGLSTSTHANPSAGRDIFFDNSCECFRYRGPTRPFQ
jgi:hypothetical protein